MSRLIRFAAVTAALVGLASSVSAQSSFPQREVTFIVPWNAGGSNDIMARALQPILKEHGVGIVIENAVGGTGTIGMRRVAGAAPDGYTIGMGTSSTLAMIAQGKTPLKNADFVHLARVSIDPLLLLVPGNSPHKTLEDFIAHMKKNPGKVSLGTPGSFNLNHIFAAMTARAAGVEYLNVPYTGGSKVVADLAGGQIEGGVLKPSETLGQITEGLVRPLGVFANERLALFPDVPTFKERGFDVFPFGPVVQMAYVAGPAGLPKDVQERLTSAFRAALQDKRFKDFADKNAFLVDDLTGDALTKEVESVGASISTVAAQVFKDQKSSQPAERARVARPSSYAQPEASSVSQSSRIKKVTCHVVAAPVQRPFTSSRGWLYKTRGTCLVEIETDDGIVGWGECYGPSAVAKAFIDTQLGPRVIGRDPFDVEVIWEDLYNRIKDYGPKGMSIAAISGIDIACWDIIGKACGKPVHKLIGGAFRTEVDAYATGLYFTDMDRLVEEAVEEADGYARAGFRAIKMKIGLGSVRRDIERVAAVRKAIGDDIRLMVDANHSLSVPNAIRMGRKLEELDVEWFEEPISPEDIDGYVEVTRALDMAVAGGENEFTRWGFRDAIVRKAMDIVQPDVCAAGGITECKKIAAMAIAHGVECVPHAWGSAVGLAATIHFLASVPDQPPCLFPVPPMLEFEQEENPFRDHLALEPIRQREGVVKVPDGPGLGIEVDRAVIDRYRVA